MDVEQTFGRLQQPLADVRRQNAQAGAEKHVAQPVPVVVVAHDGHGRGDGIRPRSPAPAVFHPHQLGADEHPVGVSRREGPVVHAVRARRIDQFLAGPRDGAQRQTGDGSLDQPVHEAVLRLRAGQTQTQVRHDGQVLDVVVELQLRTACAQLFLEPGVHRPVDGLVREAVDADTGRNNLNFKLYNK